MSDLIDREVLLKRLHDAGGCGAPPESWAGGYDKAIDLAYGMAENAPTLDPVHAANGCYCWECKYYREFRTNRNKQLMRLCYRMGKHDMEYCVKPDDFCSRGQRREEDCGDRVDKN